MAGRWCLAWCRRASASRASNWPRRTGLRSRDQIPAPLPCQSPSSRPQRSGEPGPRAARTAKPPGSRICGPAGLVRDDRCWGVSRALL
ncbi:MAG: hypothetical protein DI570_17965 [Phenylobacterium zucineum]|nr:MAG: hypothetical protein DI570_17965 [Phenylobacterium zucineum]